MTSEENELKKDEQQLLEDAKDLFFEITEFLEGTMDLILVRVAITPGHQIMIADLKRVLYPKSTTGDTLDNRFDTALKVLRAWDLIEIINNTAIKLSSEGYKLLEILKTKEELEKPYATLLTRKQEMRENKFKLLHHQVINERLQTELIPLVMQSNTSTITTNNIMRVFVGLTTLFTLITAGTAIMDFSYKKSMDKESSNTDKRIEQKDSTIQQLQVLISREGKDTTFVKIVK